MAVLFLPWILLSLLLCSIAFLLKKKWLVGCILLILIFLINLWAECISFNFFQLKENTYEHRLSVMSFNINGSTDDIENRAHKIVEIITILSPDVLFIAEFPEENTKVLDSLLAKHYLYTTCVKWNAHCFYSRYPLGVQQRLKDSVDNIGVFKCSLAINNDTFVLYGCHFASNNYTSNKKYVTPDSINNHDDLNAYLRDIELAYNRRAYEASLLLSDLANSHYPIIILGDFNDVGGSKAIRLLEDTGFKDAWWEEGCGYGATIHSPLPFRIDHILYSSNIKLNKVEVVCSEGSSDHDALYAEFYF